MSDNINLRASQDLFQDSLPLENSQSEDVNVNDSVVWRGVELSSLRRSRYELIPSVVPSSFHTVTFRLPVENGKCPSPHPRHYEDTWDDTHVRLPCSTAHTVQLSHERSVDGWTMIRERLRSGLSSATDIQQAISSYAWRSSMGSRWRFRALHTFLSQTLSKPEADYFFDSVLPGMVDLALSLDSEVTAAIPLLRRHRSYNLTISQRQAASILANAFFCTFPERNFAKECRPYPAINFTRLFLQSGELAQEKLKCFINYFRKACSRNLDGVISFSRRSINPANLPSWYISRKQFTMLHISSEGTIETEGLGMLQIDFANKYIGGGVLGLGAVQEEIMFLLCPELIVSRLFTECLDDTEALIITGVERFNCHTGYSNSFKWAGGYDDSGTARDSYRRKCRTIVALDALKFSYKASQYQPVNIFRDLNKAYCGFSFGSDGKDRISIATGNWGCGAFNGDPLLKALLQLTAAAQSDRNLVYFTFYDDQLKNTIFNMYSFLVSNNITVGELCTALSKYHIYVKKIGDVPLYDYLYSSLVNMNKIADLSNEECCSSAEGSGRCCGGEAGGEGSGRCCGGEGSGRRCGGEARSSEDVSMEDTTDSEVKREQSAGETSLEECTTSVQSGLTSSEPLSAETYSLRTEEGRKRCLQSDKERWLAYESAKTLVSSSSARHTTHSPVQKKKISDYFTKLPNNT